MRNHFTRALWLKIASIAVMATAAVTAHAGIYVDCVKGVDTNPGTAARPVQDIATAIALAQNPDMIFVANGVYTGPKNQNLDTVGKTVLIISLGGATNCIIDCLGQAQAFLFHSGETPSTQVIGFTIQNGKAPDGPNGVADSNGNGTDGGSGVRGGAIAIENSSPTIQRCVFINNSAGNGGDGGGDCGGDGLGASGAGGSGADGGAIWINGGSSLIINCIFRGNHAGSAGGPGCSGTIKDPAGGAGNGGAIAVDSGTPLIVNGLFVHNVGGTGGPENGLDSHATPGGSGGGIYASGGAILNCTFTANAAGPGIMGGSLDGDGGGIAASDSVLVTNCISINNFDYYEIYGPQPNADVSGGSCSYCDIGNPSTFDGYTDNGHNISVDPLFVRNPDTNGNSDTGNLHLTPGSPCLNMGNTAAPGLPNVDLDLQSRKQRGGIDIGAYELYNVQPILTSLSATIVSVERTAFTLGLAGTHFNQTSVVLWNGAPRMTTYVSASLLSVNVTAADLAAPATIKISVSNPGNGGGVSKTLTLTVANPKPILTKLSPATVAVGSATFTLTLTGAHFNHTSTVLWNGAKRATTFVSTTSVTIPVTATDLAAPAAIKIEVFNPGPGAGISETLALTVALPKLALSAGTLTRNATTGVITVPAVFTNTGQVTAGNVKVTAATLGTTATGTKLPVSVGNLAIGQKATTNLTFPGTVGKKGQAIVLSVTTGFTGGSWTGKLTITLP